MGMFDEVILTDLMMLPETRVELLYLDHIPIRFQTKDLECLLDIYVIDIDLHLYKIQDNYIYLNSSLWEKEFVDYTGTIEFYTYKEKYSFEYIATFNCGKLISIEDIVSEQKSISYF